jgi:hypothetical protein
MNAIVVDQAKESFTHNDLQEGCSQRLILCSFLSFWRDP